METSWTCVCGAELNGEKAPVYHVTVCKDKLYCQTCSDAWTLCVRCNAKTICGTSCLICDHQQDLCDECAVGFDVGWRHMGKTLCKKCFEQKTAPVIPTLPPPVVPTLPPPQLRGFAALAHARRNRAEILSGRGL